MATNEVAFELLKLILIALSGGFGLKMLDVLLARLAGRQAVVMSDRDELKKFIEEGRERDKAFATKEDILDAKIEALSKENARLSVQVAILQGEKSERERDLAQMKEAWASERKEWIRERAALMSRITDLEAQVKALQNGQSHNR